MLIEHPGDRIRVNGFKIEEELLANLAYKIDYFVKLTSVFSLLYDLGICKDLN